MKVSPCHNLKTSLYPTLEREGGVETPMHCFRVATGNGAFQARSRVELGVLGGVLSNRWVHKALCCAVVEIQLLSAICRTAHA